MTERYETRASTHADDCWSWGPAHYECAVREIERLRKLHQDAYQRGFQEGSRGLREAYDAIQEVKRQDAWGNAQLTEALMAAEERAERAEAENKRLRCIISDLKDWDCDVSGGFLSIPLDLRRRMQEAIDAALTAQPAASAELRCRKCGELARVVISSAQVMTHWPDGSARDERDIASDPEGTLIHDPSEPLRAAARDRTLRLADECEESAQIWAHEIDTRQRAAAELRRLHVQSAQDEAMLRQTLEALSCALQTAMEQSMKARIPECGEFSRIAQDLDFVVAALRERVGVKEQA